MAKVQAHLHLPMQAPDADKMGRLREVDRAAHDMWLKQVRKQLEHQRKMERLPVVMKLRVMRSAHVAGLIALLSVLLLAAYALHLDRPWFAGVLSALDVAAVIAVFVNGGTDDDEE